MTGSERKQLFKGLGFISPWIIGFTVFLLTPILLSLYLSFSDWSLSQQRGPLFVGMENYAALFHDEIFWKALRTTLTYAAMAIPAGLMVSLGLALMLNTQVPGQPLFRTIIFLPSLVPVVASAMLWLWMFNARQGLINMLLARVGIDGPGWLADPRWALPALAFMALWGVGHTVVIFLAGLQDVPQELYEAAEIDGATPFHRLIHVTLPMISPVIFFNLIMSIIGTFQVFTIPYAMTNGSGSPDRALYFYAMFLFDNAFHFPGRMGLASAMAWIQLLIILTLTAFAFWSSKRWVHYQGK